MLDNDSNRRPQTNLAAWLPDLSLLGVAIIWGLNIPIMKMGLGFLEGNVYVFNALRLPVSALVIGCFALYERRRGILPSSEIRFHHIAIYCVVVSVFYQLTFLMGMSRTTPGNAALILATIPMWTAILARIFIGERLRPLSLVGLGLALLGTLVVACQNDSISGAKQLLLGNFILLLAALLWAGGTVYSKPLLSKISPLQLAASSSLLGLPAHIAFALIAARSQGAPQQMGSPVLLLVVLFSGTLSSGLAQPMWHYGVRQAGAAHAAVVQNLVPLVAMLAAWVMFKLQPTLAQLVGGALILGGLCLMRMSRAHK